jgi:deoxyribonuclease (pyrimidine dimer)
LAASGKELRAMTRINCVPVEELSAKHLVAEYREIGRVYALAVSAYNRGEKPTAHGDAYTLGKGHVKFFYSRLGYVTKRHRELIAEMLRRGYNPTYRVVVPPELPNTWMRNWKPDARAELINRARILERTVQ